MHVKLVATNTVYSPFVEADNYIYEIDDPSTDEIKAPVQSFTHVLQ